MKIAAELLVTEKTYVEGIQVGFGYQFTSFFDFF
jgi:hypothetical protein